MNCCKDCKYYSDFVSICTNGKSEYCTRYVKEDGYCEKWEAVESE